MGTDLIDEKYMLLSVELFEAHGHTMTPLITYMCANRESMREHTLLLSSMSALFPTNILLTLSEACCSMFLIQFLMSEKMI